MPQQLELASPEATARLGGDLAAALLTVKPEILTVYLRGQLGAGKTELARGLLRGLGHSGRVPSPTYTLIEPYECAGYRVYHMDLYRLQDPGELEYLGLSEMLEPGSVLLIEWPEHGAVGQINEDLELELKVNSPGRTCLFRAVSPAGTALLEGLSGLNS